MKMAVRATVVFAALCLLFAASAFAEVETSAGINFRLRQESWDDLTDFLAADGATASGAPISNDTNFWRLKTSPWFKIAVDKSYIGYARLTNEARYYMDSASASNQLGLNKDELLVDNLYVSALDIAGRVSVTYGRQDFVGAFGENFLVVDGTPGDGSRTFYFDAVRTLVKLSDSWNVDFVYLTNHGKDDRLPVAHSTPQRTLDSNDNDGAIVYGRGKIGDSLTVEPYYIWKREAAIGTTIPALRLSTYGAHVVYGFADWKFHGEIALQDGTYSDDTDRSGLGGYAFIGKKYENLAFKPSFDLGYIMLSGDDAATADKHEGWDPLWSRYPWMSELYSLTLATESPDRLPAYWSNLNMLRASFKFALPADSGLDLAYSVLKADQNAAAAGTGIFGTGKDRGELIQIKLSHKFSKTVDGYVAFEEFLPGDYYAASNRDNATFVRWELSWKI